MVSDRQTYKILVLVSSVFFLFACSGSGVSARPAHRVILPSVCTGVPLTNGQALQENDWFCSTNLMNNVTTNGAGSVYKAAIDVATNKFIIVGTPTSVIACHDWFKVPETCVSFTSDFRAEHYNPSNGHVRIYDSYNRLVWSE